MSHDEPARAAHRPAGLPHRALTRRARWRRFDLGGAGPRVRSGSRCPSGHDRQPSHRRLGIGGRNGRALQGRPSPGRDGHRLRSRRHRRLSRGAGPTTRLDPDLLLLAFAGLVLVAAWRMLSHCPSCTRAGEEAELEAIDDPAPREGHALATATRRDHRIDASQVVKLVVAGTFVGFLTGLFGVGGGFVIVPALTLLLGLTMPAAIGTSLLVIAINSAVALIPRLDGAQVDWAVAVPFIVSTIAGVVTGSRLAGKLDPDKSLRAFAALLVAVAVYTGIQAILGLA
ncbi:MAG: sulfite exporter TauE/SafE family protein [Microthrixaceae bacterium]